MIFRHVPPLDLIEAFSALKLLVGALLLDMFNQLLLVKFLAAASQLSPEIALVRTLKVMHVLAFELQVIDVIVVCVLLGLFILLFVIEHILNGRFLALVFENQFVQSH